LTCQVVVGIEFDRRRRGGHCEYESESVTEASNRRSGHRTAPKRTNGWMESVGRHGGGGEVHFVTKSLGLFATKARGQESARTDPVKCENRVVTTQLPISA